jgi:hypothetical protein
MLSGACGGQAPDCLHMLTARACCWSTVPEAEGPRRSTSSSWLPGMILVVVVAVLGFRRATVERHKLPHVEGNEASSVVLGAGSALSNADLR